MSAADWVKGNGVVVLALHYNMAHDRAVHGATQTTLDAIDETDALICIGSIRPATG